jgi:thiol:disulfide interchange protein DsbD
MRKSLSIVVFLLSYFAYSQILEPVKWSFSTKDLGNGFAELQFKATMEPGWHLYSQAVPDDPKLITPVPTRFEVKKGTGYELIGAVTEEKPIEEFDPNFDLVLKYFSGTTTFRQKVRILSEKDFTIQGEVEFMACDESRCTPPIYKEFTFKVKGFVPTQEETPSFGSEEESAVPAVDSGTAAPPVVTTPVDTATPVAEVPVAGTSNAAGISLWSIFLLSFLGGFAALLTPCVFPMIPLTVSFFTKRSKTRIAGVRNALIYGAAIIILYVSIGLGITKAFGPDSLNAFSTHPIVNLAFFVILVVFAISFFGAFEITLPSSWVNKADQASERGGLIGIFFMAFTLALVSFSCTGPIIGTLLFQSFAGGIQGPLVGMFGFSLALALPFGLFAAFPGWLNSLPKSGGWLNSVKVVLGFVELAFAFKFLSTADLVWQSGILTREIFLAIWIAVGFALTFYLFGAYQLPHDSEVKKLGVGRMMLGLLSLTFTIYLIPGLWGAPLKLISGFPPPTFYAEAPGGFGGSAAVVPTSNGVPPGADPEHCPLNLNCFHDFETGMAYAREVGKPVMIDFTGWGCVNCRKMEENVWSDPRVLEKLRNDVVLISLYVDEREPLPLEEQYYSEIIGSKVRNVGNKWSEFQAKHFQTNSQPYYVFLNHTDMKPLIEPTAYDPDINHYLDWLNRGVAAFQKQQP